jgi:Tfp pilus assembly protein PilX
MLRLLERLRGHEGERGGALIFVLVLGMVMAIVVSTALTAATAGLRSADTDQDTNGALDAAYAGVQDYLARINADSTYETYGASGSAFTTASGSTVVANSSNPAFGLGTTGTWATVPGSPASAPATYRYEVDNSDYASARTVNLRSTGRVGSVTRSIIATIRQRGFIDYLYFTDYEVADPLISGTTGCAVYAWQTSRSSSCTIQFASSDSISGPVHSNDTLTICGTTFGGAVTSSNPNTPIVSTPSGCSAGTYAVNGGATYSPLLAMPVSNSTMGATAAASGCLYTGPTQVTYNSGGTMTVISPWTKATEVSGTTGTTPSMCGTLTALHSSAGATVPVLANNLLYVQDVPSVTTDPNYSSTAKAGLPANFTCLDSSANALTTSNSSAGWSFGGTSYPMSNEYPASNWQSSSSNSAWDTTSPAYGCRDGDLYVEGTEHGVTTASSSNYIYVTDDLTYSNTSTDLLGLVGGNAVLVWNPMSYSSRTGNYTSLLGDNGRTIDAAILSVAHTFQVQNYDRGAPRGTLTVLGSIAQKFRGPVGTGGTTVATGYAKSYGYDARLTTTVPPDFLPPSTSSFNVNFYAQVGAAFSATGAAQ